VRKPDADAAAKGPFSLRGRTALVTGASRGLGLEAAIGLAQAGAHALINSRDDIRATSVVEQLQRRGLSAEALAFDVCDEAATQRAFALIARRHGGLDVLVNNAAIRARAPLESISAARFRDVVDANLTSAYIVTQAALEQMTAKGHGRVIFISSVSAALAPRGDSAYVAAKGGMNALMRAIAVEFGGRGVTCNAIAPGPFLTEVNRPTQDAAAAMIQARVPLQRWGAPSELAGPVVFLASDAGSFVNGHVLVVDGGLSASFQ
jgi:gluconate 5-dehydrogenase